MSKDASNPVVDVFAYTDYLQYVRDFFAAHRQGNPKFSYRVFARQAGFSSGSTAKMVIDGKRRLTLDSARKFVRGMQLGQRQATYFQALVEYDRAETADEKANAVRKINTLRPRRFATLDESHKEYLTDVNLVTLREMLHLKNFQEDPHWIGQRLKPRLTAKEIKRAFSLLMRLGLIKRDERGRLMPTEPVVSTPVEVADMDVFSFHRAMIKRAEEALASVPAHLRHNVALTFPVPSRKMEEIKKKIHAFQKSLVELIDDGQGDFDEVFHVCVALFPATCAKEGGS